MQKQRALTATVWSGIDILLRQGLQLAVLIALAHRLTPADFGIFALLSLFTGLAAVFVDGGFSAALIQRQDINHADESTVFWINLAAALVASIALYLGAPAIARFYAQPVLVPLTAAMACNVFLSALGTIHTTLLTKRLDFRTQLRAGLTGGICSAIVATWMAWHGFGVWSLAAQSVVATLVTTCVLWLRSGWRPRFAFSTASARKLFGFGGYHFAYGVLEILYARMYTLLIGKQYGAQQLGYYNNADMARQVPGSFISGALSRVIFPMFSEAAGDKPKLRRGMQLAVRGMTLFNAPIMLGMAATAEPVVQVLFGERWLPAAPILRILCLAGILWPLLALNPYILMSLNHSRLMFVVEAAKKILGILLLALGAWFGVHGVAWGMLAFSTMAFAVNAHYTRKFIDYGLVSQLRDILPIAALAAVMAVAVYLTSCIWQASPPIKLTGLVAMGGCLFPLLAWVTRLPAVRDMRSFVRPAPAHLSPKN